MNQYKKGGLKDSSKINMFYYFIQGGNKKNENIGKTLKCGNVYIRSTTVTTYMICGMEKAINMQISVYIITFIRYPDDQKIGKPNNLKAFGSNKAKWAKQYS